MERTGRPTFKPTAPLRSKVMRLRSDGWTQERIARLIGIDVKTLIKHFAEELEHGADIKTAELLDYAEKAAKKGNATLIKWLSDRHDMARAARQLEDRANLPGAPATEAQPVKEPKRGKKEQQQAAAESVTGKFAPPPPPKPNLH